jgi:hypothetical protein
MTTYTEEEVKEIIGKFDSEGDGWDIYFDKNCCPGDDIAEYRNNLRLQQYRRAGIRIDKKLYEKQSGYIFPKKI